MTGPLLLVVPLAGAGSAVPRLAGSMPPPHVVLVDPFTLAPEEGTLAELGAFFADVVPFPVHLVGVSQFPSGSAYLTPDPAAPFRRLAHELSRVFADLPPHPTSFEDVPHIPVTLREGEDVAALQHDVEPCLPATTMAREAVLWRRTGDAVETVATFAFATSAA